MRNRKFRGDRLYKIIKIVVNVVIVATLILGVIMSTNSEKRTLHLLEENRKCLGQYSGNQEMINYTCYVYLDMLEDYRMQEATYWKIGIGLPILFYGGGALINYLFPKKNEK